MTTEKPFRVIDELDALESEQGAAARTGLLMVRYLVEAHGRLESDVVGLSVGVSVRDQRDVDRRPGESLNELERRANPGGSHRMFPMPNFSDETRALAPGEWVEAVRRESAIDANPDAKARRFLQ